MIQSKRSQYELLRSQLENERSSFLGHWRTLGDFISPRRPRFTTSDSNRGDRRNQNIVDSTASLASRTLRSGMMGGVTSPARPWFRLSTSDPDLAESAKVKNWLDVVTRRMSGVFLKSNLYNVLPIMYGDMGGFGTGTIFMEEDFQKVVRFYPIAIGSYSIAQDAQLVVNTFLRDFRMTVDQIVGKFADKSVSGAIDWTNISTMVKSMYEAGQRQQWVDVTHVIKPNDLYDQAKLMSKYKKVGSCYYERGSATTQSFDEIEDKFLRESGYDFFPVLAGRWEITGEDVYGTTCPGMEALGDIKQLQLGEKRSFQAIEKMINPPMVGPTALQTLKASLLPGDITYTDEMEGRKGLRPIHEVNINIAQLEEKQQQIRARIQRCFYEDLFLMLSQSDRRDITAREVDERHEEKLLALGPVLEQLNQDVLDPLIDNTFNLMLKQSVDAFGRFHGNGMIPQPPEELQGMDLKVEYISIMAQAQKLAGISSIERFSGFVGNIMSVSPEAGDKVDKDQLIDVYGDVLSIPPGIIRPDEDVQAIRDNRAKQQQQQQMLQSVPAAASAAKDLSQTDMSGNNALTQLIQTSKAGQLVQQ